MTEIRLTIDYDGYESGQRMDNLINELAQKPESSTLTGWLSETGEKLTRTVRIHFWKH